MSITKDVLEFWFETEDLSGPLERREVWFKSVPEFDDAIRDKFMDLYEQASAGVLDHLKDDAANCLALIIILDQFSRNLFRHTARAYAADAKARDLARHALAQGYDRDMSTWHRTFFYLPFEHSEDIEDQNLSVKLFTGLKVKRSLEAAQGHRDVIKKFGRFPYRNESLGRENTPEEVDFLKDPPPWGKTKAEFEDMQRKKKEAEGTAA